MQLTPDLYPERIVPAPAWRGGDEEEESGLSQRGWRIKTDPEMLQQFLGGLFFSICLGRVSMISGQEFFHH